MPLESPMYPPAVAFEQPAQLPHTVSLANFSLAELTKLPAAWQIIMKHCPMLELMIATPLIKPQLGNFTVHSLQTFFSIATPEVLAAIDAELARLPTQESSP